MRSPLFPWSWVAALVALPAAGATIHVPLEQPTIRAALATAAAGDTVEVSAGTYREHELPVPSGITLRGEDGDDPHAVVIDGEGCGPVLLCLEAAEGPRIAGITVRGGAAPVGIGNGGGGLHCRLSAPVVSRCRFEANEAEVGGGAACYESSPLFVECEFEWNSARSPEWAAGGALYLFASPAVLKDCLIQDNSALSGSMPGDGGGVFSKRSTVSATRCTFRRNESGAGGGGLYSFEQDQPILLDCLFEDNRSHAGGAMYLEGSFARLDACTFVGNEAANGGALFMARWSAPTITRCLFERNAAAPYSGGAADCWVSAPLYTECEFRDNTAALDGGALMGNGASTTVVRRSTFVGNEAGRYGGALRTSWANRAELTSCTLVEGAALAGGGIFHERSGRLTLQGTIVAFSAAGGALVCADTSQVDPACCVVWGNAGGDWTGCLAGWEGVAGNLAADPLFCDPSAGVVTVRTPESPCLPGNNPCGMLLGALGAGCGAGTPVPEGMTHRSWGRVKSEFR